MTAHVGPGVVVAVCTNRLRDLSARWEHTMGEITGHELFVLIDAPATPEAVELSECIRAKGGTVVVHGRTRGLSAARNTVLDACPERSILFIDDDVLIESAAMAAIADALRGGAQIVGARLVPRAAQWRRPWYFTAGQMHLVGWHTPDVDITTWGACMGIDAAFAHRHGLRFNPRLGRNGAQLGCGEDTTFVRAMKQAGGHEVLLPSVHVIHDIDPGRLTVRYLVRRAYWQGRSEVRRRQLLSGLKKEWLRYRRTGRARLLAVGYLAAFAVGLSHELVLSTRKAP